MHLNSLCPCFYSYEVRKATGLEGVFAVTYWLIVITNTTGFFFFFPGASALFPTGSIQTVLNGLSQGFPTHALV